MNSNNSKLNIKEVKDIPEDYSVKVVIVGDSGVGKSNILSRYVLDEFSNDCRATVGVELSTKSYLINDKVIKLHLWDTAGQERFKSITSAYYKGAKGAVIVYDITNKDSFDHVDKWLTEIRNLGGKGISVVVCGNKCDLAENRKYYAFLINDLKSVSTETNNEYKKKVRENGKNYQGTVSFDKFKDVNKELGPEMKSTGEAIYFIDDLQDEYFEQLYNERNLYLSK